MKSIFYTALLVLLASAVPVAINAAELKIHDAWVAAAPPVASTQAAYICFINESDKDVEITAVSAKGFAMSMIHNTAMQGDMATMEHMDTLVIPAHKMVTLEPGSMHIMLMDPEKVVVPGDKVPLTFQYSDGTKQTFTLDVKKSAH